MTLDERLYDGELGMWLPNLQVTDLDGPRQPLASACKACGTGRIDEEAVLSCAGSGCDRWYHVSCVGVVRERLPEVWHCPDCAADEALGVLNAFGRLESGSPRLDCQSGYATDEDETQPAGEEPPPPMDEAHPAIAEVACMVCGSGEESQSKGQAREQDVRARAPHRHRGLTAACGARRSFSATASSGVMTAATPCCATRLATSTASAAASGASLAAAGSARDA